MLLLFVCSYKEKQTHILESCNFFFFFFYCTPEPWVPYRVLFVLCFCGGGFAAAGLLSFTLRPIYLVFSFVCKWNVLLLTKVSIKSTSDKFNSYGARMFHYVQSLFFFIDKRAEICISELFFLFVFVEMLLQRAWVLCDCRGRAAGAAGWESPWPTQSLTLKPSFKPEWLESLLQSLGFWPFKST